MQKRVSPLQSKSRFLKVVVVKTVVKQCRILAASSTPSSRIKFRWWKWDQTFSNIIREHDFVTMMMQKKEHHRRRPSDIVRKGGTADGVKKLLESIKLHSATSNTLITRSIVQCQRFCSARVTWHLLATFDWFMIPFWLRIYASKFVPALLISFRVDRQHRCNRCHHCCWFLGREIMPWTYLSTALFNFCHFGETWDKTFFIF